MPALSQFQGRRYLSLATFRKNGEAVLTPVWFAGDGERLYVMTRDDSGKYKRLRRDPRVRVAPCGARGRLNGPWCDGVARILSRNEEGPAREALRRKYWLLRIPWLWSRRNIFLEISSPGT